jgi:hypothetical protein
MICDEAVEAAAKAVFYDDRTRTREEIFRIALEAAAPFIAAPVEAELRKARGTIATLMKLAEVSSKVGDLEKAQAWDEGFKQGGPMHDENMDDPDAHTRNPYRSGT